MLRWERGAAYARLHIDLGANAFEIKSHKSESSKEVELLLE